MPSLFSKVASLLRGNNCVRLVSALDSVSFVEQHVYPMLGQSLTRLKCNQVF